MAWSPKQQILALKASSAAGWDSTQRYLVMRYVGCPVPKGADNPSIKAPGNTNSSFELYMAQAESFAAQRGTSAKMPLPSPSSGASWREVTGRRFSREARLIVSIATEAAERLPAKFDAGFLAGFVARMTGGDSPDLSGRFTPARSPEDLDEAQIYRVIEGLKAWVLREFKAAGLMPRSFTPPKWWSPERAAGARTRNGAAA